MTAKLCNTALTLFIILALSSSALASSLKDAREFISNLQFDRAKETLIDIAVNSKGEEKQRALLLLASLKRSSDEAEILYKEILDIDQSSAAAGSALLEIAKIRFASGKYNEALDILRNNPQSASSREYLYFEGLAALMSRDFSTAKNTLLSIRKGKYAPWANLALAEIAVEENNKEEACGRYQALANAMINPVAMYKFGECLEGRGNIDRAEKQFNEIIRNFESTPEAVLASEKLKALSKRNLVLNDISHYKGTDRLPSGFTIQFGSFRDRRNAIKLAEELKQKLPGVRIDTDLVNYRELHRVRYGYFESRSDAAAETDKIKNRLHLEPTIMKMP